MHEKFSTKSARCKGLAFHPTRPLLLASLHTGSVQLWDYSLRTMLDRFDEHEGPVRSVAFHPNASSNLFASGGDDYKVKVWSLKDKRCIADLSGHIDYVRAVHFHPTQPWLLSCSDDQTIRVWNYERKTCLATLAGHNHYVMHACFSPQGDMVASCSLDQTIRLWDLAPLRSVNNANSNYKSSSSQEEEEIPVKHVLEGHERGVNWVSFHPSQPLLISGGDDRLIKLWRYNDVRAWEVDTMRGHTNNVSSVMFVAKHDLIISNSEDRSVRVWDLNKRSCLLTVRREADRFWTMAIHNDNEVAMGHDGGLVLYKLAKERTLATYVKDLDAIAYVKDRNLRLLRIDSQEDKVLIGGRKSQILASPYSYLVYNAYDKQLLLGADAEYEVVGLDGSEGPRVAGSGWPVPIGKGRVLTIEPNRKVAMLAGKQVPEAGDGLVRAYPSYPGTVVLRTEDQRIRLFDVAGKRILGEYSSPHPAKTVVWNHDFSLLAVIGRKNITLLNRRLEKVGAVAEGNIKSAMFGQESVLLFTTNCHIRYVLPNAESGVLCSLVRQPMYLLAAKGNRVSYSTRDGLVETTYVDGSEYAFKWAITNGRIEEAKRILADPQRLSKGEALVAYLYGKGLSNLAVHLVKDPKTRFYLALESGEVELAAQLASELGDTALLKLLGREALKLGRYDEAEKAFFQAKDAESLQWLYVCQGNREKLVRLVKVYEGRGDVQSLVQLYLLLGDRDGLKKVLDQVGLKYLSTLIEESNTLSSTTAPLGMPLPVSNPISAWPQLNIPSSSIIIAPAAHEEMDTAGWDEEPVAEGEGDLMGGAFDGGIMDGEGEGEGWATEEIDVPAVAVSHSAPTVDTFKPVTHGVSMEDQWMSTTDVGAHLKAGSFDTAVSLLEALYKVKISSVEILKPLFWDIYVAGRAAFPATVPLAVALPDLHVPIEEDLKAANALVTQGKFSDARASFKRVLTSAIVKQAGREVIESCREYVVGLSMELTRREIATKDKKKALELACYFTHQKMQTVHTMLALRSAMSVLYNAQNYEDAAAMAKRLIDRVPKQDVLEQARKVVQFNQDNKGNAMKLEYDERLPFAVCAKTFVAIQKGRGEVCRCGLCGATYKAEEARGKRMTCVVCEIAMVE